MQRAAEQVLEKAEVVSQLSMELLACMARGFDVDVTQSLCPSVDVPLRYVKATHRSSTSAAQHKTQANVRRQMKDGRSEMKERKRQTLLYLPSLKSLHYYWLLIVLL